MKLITTIMMLLDLFISVVSSEPRGPSGTAPEGLFDRSPSELPYPVGTMTFMGTLGGHDVQLNGSIEEVYGQMKNLYPDFNADALVLDGKLARENGTEGELNVVTRGADNKGALYCCPNDPWDWQPASNRRIWEGISYLDNLNGLCGVGARNCKFTDSERRLGFRAAGGPPSAFATIVSTELHQAVPTWLPTPQILLTTAWALRGGMNTISHVAKSSTQTTTISSSARIGARRTACSYLSHLWVSSAFNKQSYFADSWYGCGVRRSRGGTL
ncbi:uncharacterized protein PAC_07443 [Phialocephala subalpina]|uniref:Uncharacterized protein n=1 Tax=Phialocephala subalpina TaxID=576137 RepID=A0A1L7WXQ5_9HELO|nr:uncharacterized protein PAC_07443 [Phialocephala subalpina]